MTNEIMQLLRDISNKDHWAKLRLLLSLVNVEHEGEWETNTWWMNWPDTMATQYIQRHIEGEMEAESKPMTEFVSYCGLVAMLQIVGWNMKCWRILPFNSDHGNFKSYLYGDADLRGADLGGADLGDADLRGARYTERTTFSLGFQIEGRGMKKED